ncbi:MAG TPA: winged helix-turn-helix domain-containing protein [Thermoleophilaceae bacterium]|jgi:DNA-binding transcriptional ArsR family regulator
MTQLVDITDPALAKAFAHPLRIEILGLLENRVASPVQLAAELGSPLSLTSYHVRQLRHLGLVKLVKRRQQRGAVVHYYTATVRPRISDKTWSAIPSFVKRALVGGRIAQVGAEAAAAAEHGGFDREWVHISSSRLRLRLSARAWEAVARELESTLERIEAIGVAEQEALADDPKAEWIEASVALMFFETPPPDSFTLDPGGHALEPEELEGHVSG